MKKILLTGFLPFGGQRINPSQILVENFASTDSDSIVVEKLILPVSFERSESLVIEKLERERDFDFCVMLGQAGGRSQIGLEIQAFNQVSTVSGDEDGRVQVDSAIVKNEDFKLQSLVLLEDLHHRLKELQIPVEISQSAGDFVCNYLYYKTLLFQRQKSRAFKSLFVHFPYLPEQATNSQPSLELEVMKKALREILLNLN